MKTHISSQRPNETKLGYERRIADTEAGSTTRPPEPRTNFRGELIQKDPEILNRLLARAERAEAQRDELLAALKTVFTEYKRGICEIDAAVCIQAREAIAKCEASNPTK